MTQPPMPPQWQPPQWQPQQWQQPPPPGQVPASWIPFEERPTGPIPRIPQHAPPPPQRSNTGLVVALVLAAVALFGFGTVGAVALSQSSQEAEEPVAPSGPPISTSTSASETSSETSTSAPTSTSTSTSEASTNAVPVLKLWDNPLNVDGNGAVTTPCSLPEFSTDVASQDAFYQAVLPCLVRAWEPALEEAGLPTDAPHVVTTGQDINTPCGLRTWDQTALYCPQDNTIYMTARYYSEVEGRSDAGVFLGQLAHEFGHALQRLSGINGAYGNATASVGGTSPAGLELTRRSELQATCFEGMSLAAFQNGGVSNDLIFPALRDSAGRGDENSNTQDHGSIETNSRWVEQGFSKNRITECNTWLSAPGDVD